MPSSRIVFALNDLLSEIARASSRSQDDGKPIPQIAIFMDEDTYLGVERALANYFNGALKQNPAYNVSAVKLHGCDLVCGIPTPPNAPPPPEPPQEPDRGEAVSG